MRYKKTHPYTEEFNTFRSEMIRQSLLQCTNLQWQCEHFCLKIKAFIKGQNYIVNYVIPWYGMMNVNL